MQHYIDKTLNTRPNQEHSRGEAMVVALPLQLELDILLSLARSRSMASLKLITAIPPF